MFNKSVWCGFFAFLLTLLQCSADGESNKLVNTHNGPVVGQLLTTIIEHKPYYSFKGIPYAQPPSYGLRFKAPVPIKPWTKPRECFDFGNICLQYNPINSTELIGDENCLFLNVYTPEIRSTKLRPVMVFIHDGGFFFGSGNDDLQGPDFLINEDVVLVTINYRTGVLGFLSLGTAEYPGNQGLKDQRLALKWVKENIQAFGGDPERITCMGQSAGSASCHMHTLSAGSRGLFKYSIQMSFTFDMWAILKRVNHLDDMYTFAALHNAEVYTYEELIEFLTSVDGALFTTNFPIIQLHLQNTPIVVFSKWLPHIEPENAVEPFMQAASNEILMSPDFHTDVDVMTGYTTAEALFYAAAATLHPYYLTAFNHNFQIDLPSTHFNKNFSAPEYREAAQEIRDFYFPRGVAVNENWDTLQAYIQLLSDVYQVFPMDQRVKILAEKSIGKTYYYRFGMVSQLNYYKRFLGAQGQYGASHADDMCYLFRCNYTPEIYGNVTVGTPVYEMIKRMTKLYTNFATSGIPWAEESLQWNPVSPGHIAFLDIKNDGLTVGLNPYKKQIDFWNKLIQRYPTLMTSDADSAITVEIYKILNKYTDSEQ